MKRLVVGVGLLAVALALGVVLRCRHHERRASSASPVSSGAAGSRAITGNSARQTAREAPRGAIAGTVKTAAGTPVAGARVCADGRASDVSKSVFAEPRCTATDSTGRYALGELYAGAYDVAASAPTFQPAMYRAPVPREDAQLLLTPGQHLDGIDLVLVAGGVQVTGVVTDTNGGPIANARVWASDLHERDTTSIETDAQGAFALWVSPGNVTVAASADGYQTGFEEGNAPGTLTVQLEPASALAGRVVDATTDAAIAGARIFLDDRDTGELSGPDGSFRLTELAAGRYTVSARTSHGFGRARSVRVEVGAEVDGIVIALAPALRIVGTVVIDGSPPRPCEDAHVRLDGEDFEEVPRLLDGTFEVGGLFPGEHTIAASCAGFVDAPVDTITLGDRDAVDRVWRVSAGGTVRGRVTTRSGAPVGDTPVRLTVDSRVRETRTGPDGRYAFVGVPAGRWRLEPTLDGAWMPTRDDDEVTVTAGETTERDLVLEELGTLRGQVVDTHGEPVRRWALRISDKSDGPPPAYSYHHDTTTDDAGMFVIPRVPAGRYRFDDPEMDAVVHAGRTTELKLVVPPANGMIRGVVVGPDGKPVGDAHVDYAYAGSNWHMWQLTGPDGTFALSHLRTTDRGVDLKASDAAGRTAIASEVKLGSTVTLQLVAGAAVEGTITGAPDLVKLKLTNGNTTLEDTLYRTGGTFAFEDLAAGPYTLSVEAPEGGNRVDLELAPGERKRMTFAFGRFLTVTARVIDAKTRAPVPGMQVALLARDGDDHGQLTDASGRVTLERVIPGRVTLSGVLHTDAENIAFSSTRMLAAGNNDFGDVVAHHAPTHAQGDPGFEIDLEMFPDCRPWVETYRPITVPDLEPRDIILAVNGIEVTGYGCALAYGLLHGPPGVPIRVTLERGPTLTIVPGPPRADDR